MPAVKKKPVAKSAAKGKGDWFHKKSPAAQKAYIAKHPTSIYAKQAKKAGATPAKGKGKALPGTDAKLADKYNKMLDTLMDKEPKEGSAAHAKWLVKANDLSVKYREARFGTKSALRLKAQLEKSAAKKAKATTKPTAKAAGPKKSPELKKLEAAHKALERTGPKGVPKTPAERAAYVKWREKIAKSAAAIRKATPEKRKKLTLR